MGTYESFKNSNSGKSVDVTFAAEPATLAEFAALPQTALSSPFDAAAMTVLAFAVYAKNRDAGIEMVNFLKGPRPLSPMELQFIRDRFMDKDYVPRSYFAGSSPENDYTPALPLTVTVSENPYSYQNEGYADIYVKSSGADSPRYIRLREAKDGKWYLWEQFILVDVRQPESQNPWA